MVLLVFAPVYLLVCWILWDWCGSDKYCIGVFVALAVASVVTIVVFKLWDVLAERRFRRRILRLLKENCCAQMD